MNNTQYAVLSWCHNNVSYNAVILKIDPFLSENYEINFDKICNSDSDFQSQFERKYVYILGFTSIKIFLRCFFMFAGSKILLLQ